MSESVVPKHLAAEARTVRLHWSEQTAYYQILAIEAHTREMGRIADALETLAAHQAKAPLKPEEESGE